MTVERKIKTYTGRELQKNMSQKGKKESSKVI